MVFLNMRHKCALLKAVWAVKLPLLLCAVIFTTQVYICCLICHNLYAAASARRLQLHRIFQENKFLCERNVVVVFNFGGKLEYCDTKVFKDFILFLALFVTSIVLMTFQAPFHWGRLSWPSRTSNENKGWPPRAWRTRKDEFNSNIFLFQLVIDSKSYKTDSEVSLNVLLSNISLGYPWCEVR